MRREPQIDAMEMELLFKEHHALLCLVSFGIVKDQDLAKDIVQDFFISYWQRRSDVALTASFKTYAVRAVKNLSLLALKKSKKERTMFNELVFNGHDEQKPLGRPENGQKVRELLNMLPESRKNIFVSYVIYGQSYSEIAKNNGISVNTVKTQMKRAYSFLRTEANPDMLYLFFLCAPELLASL